jgi:hypothetical protein
MLFDLMNHSDFCPFHLKFLILCRLIKKCQLRLTCFLYLSISLVDGYPSINVCKNHLFKHLLSIPNDRPNLIT